MSASQKKEIKNAVKVIERFGGIRPMAKKIDVAVTTVQGWKKRKVIPAGRREEILQAAKTHGIELQDLLGDSGLSMPKAGAANQNRDQQAGSKSGSGSAGNESSADEIRPAQQTAQPRSTAQRSAESESKNSRKSADTAIEITRTLDEKLKEMEYKIVKKNFLINTGVAAILILIAGAFAFYLQPWSTDQQQLAANDERLAKIENEVQSLNNNVNELQQDQSMLGGLIPENLGEQLSELRNQALETQAMVSQAWSEAETISRDVLANDGRSLQERLTTLEGYLSENGQAPVLTGLLSRFTALQNSVGGQGRLDQAVSELSAIVTSFKGPAEGLDEVLLNATRQSSVLNETFQDVPSQDIKAAALLLGMTQFRQSLNRNNVPFEDDMQLLVRMTGTENPELLAALERLAPHAESGVLTPSGLTEEFKTVTGDAVVASLKGEDVSFSDRVMGRLSELFQVKKDGELVNGTPTQQKLARAETLLEQGKLEEAIKQVESIEGEAAVTVAPWLDQAYATLNAQNVKRYLSDGIAGATLSGGRLYQDPETGINVFKPGSRAGVANSDSP